jgi:hypothetical protein
MARQVTGVEGFIGSNLELIFLKKVVFDLL